VNTTRHAMLRNVVTAIILSLACTVNLYPQPVRAQEGGDPDHTTQSKSEGKLDRSQLPSAYPSITAAGVQNPGFENGSDGSWTEYSTHGWAIIVNAAALPPGVTPHAGQWAAWLGGEYDDISSISQSVAITQGASTLSFWEWIASADSCGYDFGEVLINATVVTSIDLCSEHNTNGWVHETVDLGAYIGQTVALQFRVETDSSYNSNLFIDDVTLTGGSGGETRVLLPAVLNNYCTYHYFDDFSDPNSGWGSGDDTNYTYGYLAGEYQLLIKSPNGAAWDTPNLVLPANYTIEVDAYQPSNARSPHGIVFGARGNGGQTEYYQFVISAATQQYLLQKKYSSGNWSTVIPATGSATINQNASNHLRVDRAGASIRLYINGIQVNSATDSSLTGAGRDAGVKAYSGNSVPVDTRFDNFRADCLP
jgi:hypothetical protein